MNIVCDADSFCYGPVATLLSIVEALGNRAEVTLLAEGAAFELASKNQGLTVIPCNLSSSSEVEAAFGQIRKPDIVLSVLGYETILFAQKIGVMTAYVDPLYWLWPSAHEQCLRDVDIYFADASFEPAIEKTPLWQTLKRGVAVGPFVRKAVASPRERSLDLLICFGGMDSVQYNDLGLFAYHLIMTREILSVCSRFKNPIVPMFASGEKIASHLREEFPSHARCFRSMSHGDFLNQLALAKRLLTIPGANTPFEAFALDTPCYFLPPSNYSQVLQLRALKNAGLAGGAPSVEQLVNSNELPANLPEQDGIRAVEDGLRRLACSQTALVLLGMYISDILGSPEEMISLTRSSQRSYFDALPSSGSDMVSEALLQMDFSK